MTIGKEYSKCKIGLYVNWESKEWECPAMFGDPGFAKVAA